MVRITDLSSTCVVVVFSDAQGQLTRVEVCFKIVIEYTRVVVQNRCSRNTCLLMEVYIQYAFFFTIYVL